MRLKRGSLPFHAGSRIFSWKIHERMVAWRLSLHHEKN